MFLSATAVRGLVKKYLNVMLSRRQFTTMLRLGYMRGIPFRARSKILSLMATSIRIQTSSLPTPTARMRHRITVRVTTTLMARIISGYELYLYYKCILLLSALFLSLFYQFIIICMQVLPHYGALRVVHGREKSIFRLALPLL